MTIQTQKTDPYAPPPRHKDASGKFVRVLILAGILGVAGAGYAVYSDRIEEAKNTPFVQEEQQFAEAPAMPAEEQPLAAPAPTESSPPVPVQREESVNEAPLPPPTTSVETAPEPVGAPG